MPHLRGRPLTLKRYPNGVDAPHFYEKQCPSHAPDWVQSTRIGDIKFCLCEDLPTLVWLANLADLDWIPFAVGVLILLALRVAAIGDRRSLIDLAVIAAYVMFFALGRYVYRLYIFGHDLSPQAAINIQPFMPVVIGTKQVANFTVSSYPRLGGLLMMIFTIGVAALAIWQLFRALPGPDAARGAAGNRRRAQTPAVPIPPSARSRSARFWLAGCLAFFPGLGAGESARGPNKYGNARKVKSRSNVGATAN